MAGPNDPPDPEMPSAVFSALAAMTYSSTDMAFKDGAGTEYWLYVERKTNTVSDGRWYYGTSGDQGTHPKGLIPQLTYDVIHGGTLNSQTQKIAYQSQNYRIRLYWDATTSKQLAQAIVVP